MDEIQRKETLMMMRNSNVLNLQAEKNRTMNCLTQPREQNEINEK